MEDFLVTLRRELGREIGENIIAYLQPVFEKSATNLLDALISVEDEIVEIIVAPLEDGLPSVIAEIIKNPESKKYNELLEEHLGDQKIRSLLKIFFEDFSAGDLYSEIRELISVEKLDDNLEFYIYLGELKQASNVFPIFYIPISARPWLAKPLNYNDILFIGNKKSSWIWYV